MSVKALLKFDSEPIFIENLSALPERELDEYKKDVTRGLELVGNLQAHYANQMAKEDNPSEREKLHKKYCKYSDLQKLYQEESAKVERSYSGVIFREYVFPLRKEVRELKDKYENSKIWILTSILVFFVCLVSFQFYMLRDVFLGLPLS